MKNNLSLMSLLLKLSTLASTTDIDYDNTLQFLQQWNLDTSNMNLDSEWEPINPLNYAVIEDFSNPIGWFGSPTLVIKTGQISQSVFGSDNYILSKDFSSPMPIFENFIFNFSISDVSLLGYLYILLAEDGGFNNYYTIDITDKLTTGDNKIVINKNDFLVNGTAPSWDNINSIIINFKSNDETKQLTVVTKSIESYTPRPLCTIFFDNAWESVYTNAYPIMKAKNFPAAASVITSFVGEPPFSTLTELQKMNAAGWEITNNTESHQNLPNLTPEQAETEVKNAMDYLINSKFGLGSFNFNPPDNAVNAVTLNIIKKYAITCVRDYNNFNLNPKFDLSNLSFMLVSNTTSVSEITQWIDDAIIHGYWLILMFHSIETPATTDTQYSIENFQQVIQYLYSRENEIDTTTITNAIMSMYQTALPLYV